MAYEGYLIKVGNYIIPSDKYIKRGSYSAYINTIDQDSYRDGDKYLQRNVSRHRPAKVEFSTPDLINNINFEEFMWNIRRNYINELEKSFQARVYIFELGEYVSGKMYMTDLKPVVNFETEDGILYLDPVKVTFVGY